MATATYQPNSSGKLAAPDAPVYSGGFSGLTNRELAEMIGSKAYKHPTAEDLAAARGGAEEQSAPPPRVEQPMEPSDRTLTRLGNAGISLAEFQAMTKEQQTTLLLQLMHAESQAMIKGFDAAKLKRS